MKKSESYVFSPMATRIGLVIICLFIFCFAIKTYIDYHGFLWLLVAILALFYCMIVVFARKVEDYIINLDDKPFVPNGWTLEEHQKDGLFKWNPKKVKLYLSRSQKNGKSIEGNNLREELADKRTFNANLLDWLLANPHLIPENWKRIEQDHTHCIFFWGTIYRNSDGFQCTRCLCWSDDKWRWSFVWLGYRWDVHLSAALHAN